MSIPPSIPAPILLLLNLPPSTLCGIDLLSFTTSPRFCGIKATPPGWHFIFTGATASMSIRQGFWVHISNAFDGTSAQLLIYKWNPCKEELELEGNETDLMRWRANVGSIWKEGLMPYRQNTPPMVDGKEIGNGTTGNVVEESQDWEDLTSHITPELLGRVLGGADWALTTASCAKQDRDDIPGLSAEDSVVEDEKELCFLEIDLTRTWREGAVGRERTEGAVDRSWALGNILGPLAEEGWRKMLGEMQFCFLMVLTLSNYSCLEQWKRILGLVLTCKQAVREREDWFAEALELLRKQLKRCEDVEGGLFDFSDEGGALLKKLLKGFKRCLDEVFDKRGGIMVKEAFEELESLLRGAYGWELGDSYVRRGMLELEDGEQVEMEMNELEGEDERGEYAPVVVHVD